MPRSPEINQTARSPFICPDLLGEAGLFTNLILALKCHNRLDIRENALEARKEDREDAMKTKKHILLIVRIDVKPEMGRNSIGGMKRRTIIPTRNITGNTPQAADRQRVASNPLVKSFYPESVFVNLRTSRANRCHTRPPRKGAQTDSI